MDADECQGPKRRQNDHPELHPEFDRGRTQDEAPDGRFDGVWVPGTHRRPSLRVTPSEPTRVGRSPCFAQKSSQAVWRWVSSLMSKPPGASLGKARSNSNTMFS